MKLNCYFERYYIFGVLATIYFDTENRSNHILGTSENVERVTDKYSEYNNYSVIQKIVPNLRV